MIVAGFGFRAAATGDSLRSALAKAGGGAEMIAAPADKCAAPAFRAFAQAEALSVIAVSPADLAGADTLTASPQVQARRGTGSVAEASALAAAGPGARLRAPRAISDDRMATCAIALGASE